MKKTLIVIFTFSTSLANANSATSIKKGVDIYFNYEALIETPQKIITLTLKINNLFHSQGDFRGLSNELLKNLGYLKKDDAQNLINIKPITCKESEFDCFKISLINLKYKPCKHFTALQTKTNFFEDILINNKSLKNSKEKPICNKNKTIFYGINKIDFISN